VHCPMAPNVGCYVSKPVRFRRERMCIIQRSLKPAQWRKGLHPRGESVTIRTEIHCRSVYAGLYWDTPINQQSVL
jgi:hypothetical protein